MDDVTAPAEAHALIPDHAHPASHEHLDTMYSAMVELWGEAFTAIPADEQLMSILVAWNDYELHDGVPGDVATRILRQAHDVLGIPIETERQPFTLPEGLSVEELQSVVQQVAQRLDTMRPADDPEQ